MILETPMLKLEMEDHHHLGANPTEEYSSLKQGALKAETAADAYARTLGKRVHRSLAEEEEEDSSSAYDESNGLMTSFAGDPISNILGMKPFRSVIKRYWTEDEVTIYPLYYYY